MGARLGDSRLFAHLWGTDELRAVFDETAVVQRWLDVLVALAGAQAELGIVPADAAADIARHARAERLDLDLVAAESRRTGHSTLGLIRGLEAVLPASSHPWVYYGATVQDLTDTATSLALRRVGGVVWRDLRAAEGRALDLAAEHRDTVQPGRTHGQVGAPVTFGLKAASWADELRRHLHRLAEGAQRWLAVQLGGAVGTLGFFGELGPALRERFAERLGLADPGIAWLTARDRVAEFGQTLALVTATAARIGNEVYQLQRTEIGELREPAAADAVGSITMPHKRNPEAAEHLVTLNRLVRSQVDVLCDAMVGEHERDGRAWKSEWPAVPEACLLAGASVAFLRRLLDGVEVDAAAMRRNVESARGYSSSERVLAELAGALGKHRAQALLQEALRSGTEQGLSLAEALRATPAVTDHLDGARIEALLAEPAVGSAGAAVDGVVDRGRRERAREPHAWPPPSPGVPG